MGWHHEGNISRVVVWACDMRSHHRAASCCLSFFHKVLKGELCYNPPPHSLHKHLSSVTLHALLVDSKVVSPFFSYWKQLKHITASFWTAHTWHTKIPGFNPQHLVNQAYGTHLQSQELDCVSPGGDDRPGLHTQLLRRQTPPAPVRSLTSSLESGSPVPETSLLLPFFFFLEPKQFSS